MKRLLTGLMFALCTASFCGSASATARGSANEAVAMVGKAATYMKENGNDKAFSTFANTADPTFHDRDLYIFVYDMKGVAVAHGNNPKMVGKNLLEMKDTDGKPIIRSFIDVANSKGKGWVDYKWPNPVTKTVELKSSYIEKVGDLIVGCGIYK